ncbi:hypothetical protein [Bradyrhizobium sp.]|jgi:hypothetical protein|uniref:hypothetical protein n=1 Tax=Bradyrhizobium sp. TaxID=376 RepID=UPI00271FEB7A|nr:hypothetical protein [Bradyrhizobium sp.]MDO9298659.1 hypothetical protein [Bradyrhizobium sp.]
MALISTDQNLDECVSKVRFVPNGKGLVARFEAAGHETSSRTVSPAPLGPLWPRHPTPESSEEDLSKFFEDTVRETMRPAPLGAGEHRRELSLGVDASQDHGIITIPVRLPRYLMPDWSQEDWSKFIDGEIGFFHNFVDETVVQCLSLALAANDERRAEILRTADEVVVDFRGDLPNKYLPMILGGYKVGVHRSGNSWPIWLSIQPTYDLASKKAESIRAEANLPKNKSVTAAGALANYLTSGLTSPILSNSSSDIGIRGWITAGALIVIGLVAWLMKQ